MGVSSVSLWGVVWAGREGRVQNVADEPRRARGPEGGSRENREDVGDQFHKR